jgi:hypothetical protein
VRELFGDDTNRRALLIACGVLILQQLCAINTVMYYVRRLSCRPCCLLLVVFGGIATFVSYDFSPVVADDIVWSHHGHV